MILKNTCWSSIRLFGEGYMFSFAHIGDMDFSFHWTRHWQVSDQRSTAFSMNENRGRSWARNV